MWTRDQSPTLVPGSDRTRVTLTYRIYLPPPTRVEYQLYGDWRVEKRVPDGGKVRGPRSIAICQGDA